MRTQFHKMRTAFVEACIGDYSRLCYTSGGTVEVEARDWVSAWCGGGEL